MKQRKTVSLCEYMTEHGQKGALKVKNEKKPEVVRNNRTCSENVSVH